MTDYIGAITGVVGAVAGIYSLVRTHKIKSLDLRLELRTTLADVHLALTTARGLVTLGDRSRQRVLAARGLGGSGAMVGARRSKGIGLNWTGLPLRRAARMRILPRCLRSSSNPRSSPRERRGPDWPNSSRSTERPMQRMTRCGGRSGRMLVTRSTGCAVDVQYAFHWLLAFLKSRNGARADSSRSSPSVPPIHR